MIKFWKQNTKKTSFKLNKKIFFKVFLHKNKNNILKKDISEGFLKRNSKLSYIIFNHKNNNIDTEILSKNQSIFLKKNLNTFDFFLYKQFNLLFLNKKKQNFYFIRDFANNIKTFLYLNWNNISFQNFFSLSENNIFLVKENKIKEQLFILISKNSFEYESNNNLVLNFKQNSNFDLFVIKNFFIFKNLFFSFTCNYNIINKYLSFYFFDILDSNNFNFKKMNKEFLIFFSSPKKYNNMFIKTFNKFLRLKHQNFIYFNNYFVNKYLNILTRNVRTYNLKNNLYLNIWKKQNIKKLSKVSFFKTNKKQQVSSNIILIFTRIEEKIKHLQNTNVNETVVNKLQELKNFLWYILNKNIKNNKKRTLILSKLKVLYNIRSIKWKLLFEKVFLNFLRKQNLKKNLNIKDKIFYLKIYNKIVNKQKVRKLSLQYKENTNKFFKFLQLKQKLNLTKKPLNIKEKLTHKKIVSTNNYLSLQRQKQFLSFFLGSKTMLYFVNTLSLSKYSFKSGINKSTVNMYLSTIEREMVNKYKYVATYIKDLVYISYVSFFLKKASFLVKFIAFQLEKLPKDRKQTKFLNFVKRVVKVFSGECKEIVGVRIKFKGRINRWRRTKIVSGYRGVVLDMAFDTRIEYGSAKAIIRKGSFGIHLWIAYKPEFKKELYKVIWNYMTYSKVLRLKTLKNFYYNFN